jgi:hypothetical protein
MEVSKYGSCFSLGTKAPSGPGPRRYRGFTLTLRRTTVGRTPLDENTGNSCEYIDGQPTKDGPPDMIVYLFFY